MKRPITIVFLMFVFCTVLFCSCTRSMPSQQHYGKVVEKLPELEEAKQPYPLPPSYQPKKSRPY